MTLNDPWLQLVDRLSKEWLLHFMKWIAWLAIDDDDDWWWDPWWWWCCWSSWRSLYPGSRGSDIDLIDYSIKNHSSHVLTRSVQGTFLAWFSAHTILRQRNLEVTKPFFAGLLIWMQYWKWTVQLILSVVSVSTLAFNFLAYGWSNRRILSYNSLFP